MIRFFINCWTGEEPLWKAYWLGGLLSYLLFFLIGILAGLVLAFTVSPDGTCRLCDAPITNLAFILFSVPVSVWWGVSVYRCSANSNSKIWKFLAKAAVYMTAIGYMVEIWKAGASL
jgi:hypothetical protein